MTKERRIHRRKLINARVLLKHPSVGEHLTYTHDISDGGVFVLLQNTPDLPLASKLDMQLLDSGQPDVVFKMEIARIDKLGLGLKFLSYEKNGKSHDMDVLRKEWEQQAKN